MSLRVKRVYEPPSAEDGVRVLVDRLWPRGRTKEATALDDWLKEIAPSDGLRKWSHHDPARWKKFQQRYAAELDEQPAIVSRLRELASRGTVTLLYGARNPEMNNAVALKHYLERTGTVRKSRKART